MFTRLRLCSATVGLSMLLTLAAKSGRAVDPNQPATSYIRTAFTVEDGLSSNVVNAIVQTRNGFLWIGTGAGLHRFDGKHFTPIYFRGPRATPQGIVSALAEGPDGDLWIGTSAGLVRIPRPALDRFDRSLSVFYHPGADMSDEITCLRFTRDGVLWVGTGAGLYRFGGNRFETVIAHTSISWMEESADGHLLVISSQGFIELDGTRVVEHPGLSGQLGVHADQIYQVFQDRKGAVWFCTILGLARRENGSIERLQPYGPGGHGVFRVYEDPQGNLWVGGLTSAQGTGGIFRVSGTKLESLAPSIQVRAISADREGNLWVGTNGEGLMRFKDRPIRIFTKADGLPNNIPMTVLPKRDGSLWVGNNCGGLSVFNGKRFKTYDEKDGLSNSCVWALAEGESGELWVGTWGGGLFRFAHGHFDQFDSRQGLAGDIVRAITIAHDGSLWIATDGGLSHMTDGKFRNYSLTDGLSSNRVFSVYQDRHGGIWVGTSRGVNRMTGDRFAPVLSAHEIFDPGHISMGEDSSGDLYALSAPKGVDRIEGNHLEEVNHDLDLLSMVISRGGELWFTGGNGIFRFSEAAFRQSHNRQENPADYAWFGRTDGMATTQCSVGTPNMAVAADGKLWVSTVQGLAMLDLPRLHFDSAKPVIFVEEVTVGRESQMAGRELVLPPGTHHVELHFDSISLASPEKIRFQYRMDDVDPLWLEADNSLTAVYTNIPVGTHAFKIRACNSSGVWDRSGISFPVIQKPYFYETGWFRLVATMAFVLTLIGAYRLRLRQIRAQMSARFDERVAERTRLARDLHDTLLQTLQGSKLVADEALEHRSDVAYTHRSLEKLSEWIDRATREGRAALNALHSRAFDNRELSERLQSALDEREPNGVSEGVLTLSGTPVEMVPIITDEICRIGYEAIRNAFMHSGATRIEVQLTYSEDFTLIVRDNGCGMDSTMASLGRDSHFGLQSMRERAARIHGEFQLISAPNLGTTIELKIGGKTAFAQEAGVWSKLLSRLTGSPPSEV